MGTERASLGGRHWAKVQIGKNGGMGQRAGSGVNYQPVRVGGPEGAHKQKNAIIHALTFL